MREVPSSCCRPGSGTGSRSGVATPRSGPKATRGSAYARFRTSAQVREIASMITNASTSRRTPVGAKFGEPYRVCRTQSCQSHAASQAFRLRVIVPAPNVTRCPVVRSERPGGKTSRPQSALKGRAGRQRTGSDRHQSLECSIVSAARSARGAYRPGAARAAGGSTRHRHVCGPVGGQPSRAPLVGESAWLGHVFDVSKESAPWRMGVTI